MNNGDYRVSISNEEANITIRVLATVT